MKHTQQIANFIKATLEIGGAFVVDEDWYIRDVEGELVTLDIKGKQKPMVVYNDKMVQGEYAIINPMVETISATAERVWYFDTISRICGGMIHNLIDAIIHKVIAEIDNAGDGSFTSIEQFSDVTKIIDKKLAKECNKLHASNILTIYYSGREHIAQAQTDLDDIAYMDELNVRKRSFAAFQGILCTLLDTKLEELSSKYSYKSKHIGFGKTDAMLNLYVMILTQLHPFVEALLPEVNQYQLGDIMAHMENLKAYNKDCAWFASGSSVKKIDDEEPQESAPWQQPQTWQQGQQQPMQQPQPQQQMMQPAPQAMQPQTGQMIAAPITSMIRPAPFVRQPTMQYPGYGQPMMQPQQQMMQPMMQQQPMMQPQQPGMYMPQHPGMMQQPGAMQQQGMMQPAMYQPTGPINTQPMNLHGESDKPKLQYKGGGKIKYKV